MTDPPWTKTKPTEPGYYWMRKYIPPDRIVRVFRNNLRSHSNYRPTPLDYVVCDASNGHGNVEHLPNDTLWSGPLKPPE